MTELSLGEQPPTLQPPTLLRRHAAGTDSARSVLFTVLGELVLRTGGEAWTSAFIDVFGRLGVEEKAARQALMRTAADSWLSPERVGRGCRLQPYQRVEVPPSRSRATSSPSPRPIRPTP